MKKSPWLDTLENATLVSLGVGSVVSLILKQALYATTPLSLLAVLGLLNRSRQDQMNKESALALSEVEDRLSKQVELINQHVATLPAPETIQRLKKGLLLKNREVATHLYAEINAVQQQVNQRLAELDQQTGSSVQQDLQRLNEKYTQLSENLAQFSKELARQSNSTRVEGLEASFEQLKWEIAEIQSNIGSPEQVHTDLHALQEQVARLDRQLSKIPAPVDVSSLRQKVDEIVNLIADLVPRRDLLTLTNDLKELRRQQEAMKQSVEAIGTAAANVKQPGNLLSAAPAPIQINSAAGWNAIFGGESETEAATEQPDLNLANGYLPASAYAELQELAEGYLDNVRSQLANIQEVTENLSQQHKQLRDQVNQLPQKLDVVALQQQLDDLSYRIPSPETTFDMFKDRVQGVLQQELQYINEKLRSLPNPPNYELVFDLNGTQGSALEQAGMLAGSRAILEEALDCTQERLILIWPWSNQCSLDQALMDKLEAFLKQNRRLDLGWCHLADRNEDRLLGKIKRGWISDPPQQNLLQETLHKLLYLKRTYPDHFQFKILGTSENFLVSDRSFAVLGIADTLKTSTAYSDLQLKLRTRDPEVIQRLTNCFDQPTLAPNDLTAYWNRAVTRYDLGDRAGAIADYSHILHINPDDDMTYNYRGLAYYDTGDLEAAIADFTLSIQYNPHQKAAYCNRGLVRSEQGDQWGAINDYSLALQAQPDFPIAYLYRGIAWQKLGEHRGAVADYSEAIHYAPDSAVARYYRGLAWQKLENYREAIADLALAAEQFTQRGSKTNAQKAQKHLDKLKQLVASLPEPEVENGATSAYASNGTRQNGASPFNGSDAIANLFEDAPAPTHEPVDGHQADANGSDANGSGETTEQSSGAIGSFFKESAIDSEAEDAPTVVYPQPDDVIVLQPKPFESNGSQPLFPPAPLTYPNG